MDAAVSRSTGAIRAVERDGSALFEPVRAGGVLGVGAVVAGIAPPSIRGAAVLGALPVALAAVAVGRFGIETRRRGLEEITAVELHKALEAR